MKSLTLTTARRSSSHNTHQRALKLGMAQRRGVFQNVLRILESQNNQLFTLLKKVDDLQEQVKTLQPQTYLHPIPKPRQGKDFHRSTSVAGWLYGEIEKLNERIPSDQQRYLQFPRDIPFRRLNSDCIRELEGLLSYHIPELCGEVTWEDACRKRQRDCEKIIREARILPELAVFAQAAGQWALRMICANKMRTMLATKTSKKSKRDNIPNEDAEGPCREGEVLVDMQDAPQYHLAIDEIEKSYDVPIASVDEEISSGSEIDNVMDQEQEYFDGEGHEGNELLEDFPRVQEMNITEGQEVNEECEMTSPRFQPPIGSQNETEKVQNDSLAQIQAEAQLAANRVLNSQKGLTYHHERVFNHPIGEFQSARNPSVGFSEKPVSNEVKKTTSSKSVREKELPPIQKARTNEAVRRTVKNKKSLPSPGQSRYVAASNAVRNVEKPGKRNLQNQVGQRSGSRVLVGSSSVTQKTGIRKKVTGTGYAVRVSGKQDGGQRHAHPTVREKQTPRRSGVATKAAAKSRAIVKRVHGSRVSDYRKEGVSGRVGSTRIELGKRMDPPENVADAIAPRAGSYRSRQKSRR